MAINISPPSTDLPTRSVSYYLHASPTHTIATSHAHTLGVSGQWLRPLLNLPPDGVCHAKSGPAQKWSPGPLLATKTGPGGPLLVAKTGPGGPLLAAKSGPPLPKVVPPQTNFGSQKWSPQTNFGSQKWSPQTIFGSQKWSPQTHFRCFLAQ